jgi:hypothetical protein
MAEAPASIVMTTEDMVDAALAGLDRGELVTIPSLHDEDEWTKFEAARRTLSQRFGNSAPAPRYRPRVSSELNVSYQAQQSLPGADAGSRNCS